MKFSIEIPDSVALALRGTESNLKRAVKISLAASFYGDRLLSLGEAALLAEVNKIDFLEYINKKGISVIDYNEETLPDDLYKDYQNAKSTVNRNE